MHLDRWVTCIYLNAQPRWPLRIWHCQYIMNHLKESEIDKEKVHFTIDLVPGLSLHRIHHMHQNQACFPVHKGIHLVLLHGKPEEVRERIIKIGSAFGQKRAEPDIAEHASLRPSSLVALAVSPSCPPATSKLVSLTPLPNSTASLSAGNEGLGFGTSFLAEKSTWQGFFWLSQTIVCNPLSRSVFRSAPG